VTDVKLLFARQAGGDGSTDLVRDGTDVSAENSQKAVSIYNKVISFGDKAQDFIVDIAKDEVE